MKKNNFFFPKTFLVFVFIFLSQPYFSWSYVQSRNSSGTLLKWPSPAAPSFIANWNNANGLSYAQIFTSFTNSLQRWKALGTASIDFSYAQSASTVADYAYDGQNAVFFSSASPTKLGASVLGVTYVYSSGASLVETDVEFNDTNFIFTTNPSDSSQFGNNTKVFLENVATHEFGHAYGLSHSAVLQASMVFLESRAQSKPSCDEQLGLGQIYPASGFSSARGSLSGTVLSGGVTPVFGAHVLAISKTRDTVVEGAITDSTGAFTLTGLEPGTYYLMLEPFQMGSPISALCGGSAVGCAFGSVNSSTICTGSPFKRSFVEASSGVLQDYSVTAGIDSAIGSVNISCSAMADSWAGANAVVGTAPTLLSANAGAEVQTAVWGVIGAVGTYHYYLLQNVTGNISIGAQSYGLYSPFDARVTLLDNTGTAVASGVSTTDNVFSSTSSFINYNSSANLTAAPAANYYIRIMNAGNLSQTPALYPAGSVGRAGLNPQIDNVNYYVLNVRINDSTVLVPSSASPTLTNNARCEKTDSFSAYPDTGSPPPSRSLASSGGSGSGTSSGGSKGCGILKPVDSPKEKTGFSRDLFFNSIWFLTFLMALVHFASRAYLHLARSKNRR